MGPTAPGRQQPASVRSKKNKRVLSLSGGAATGQSKKKKQEPSPVEKAATVKQTVVIDLTAENDIIERLASRGTTGDDAMIRLSVGMAKRLMRGGEPPSVPLVSFDPIQNLKPETTNNNWAYLLQVASAVANDDHEDTGVALLATAALALELPSAAEVGSPVFALMASRVDGKGAFNHLALHYFSLSAARNQAALIAIEVASGTSKRASLPRGFTQRSLGFHQSLVPLFVYPESTATCPTTDENAGEHDYRRLVQEEISYIKLNWKAIEAVTKTLQAASIPTQHDIASAREIMYYMTHYIFSLAMYVFGFSKAIDHQHFETVHGLLRTWSGILLDTRHQSKWRCYLDEVSLEIVACLLLFHHTIVRDGLHKQSVRVDSAFALDILHCIQVLQSLMGGIPVDTGKVSFVRNHYLPSTRYAEEAAHLNIVVFHTLVVFFLRRNMTAPVDVVGIRFPFCEPNDRPAI